MAIRDTVNGYNPWSVISALQKSIRRGMEYEAFWWAHELMISKMATGLWNRLVTCACEDVGMGNPNAISIVQSCRKAWMDVNDKKETKDWEWSILAHAIIILCRSDKTRSADDLSHLVWLRKEGRDPKSRQPGAQKSEKLTIPEYALDMHTASGKKRLSIEAAKLGEDPDEYMTKTFREVGARLDRPIRDISNDGTNWTEEICKLQGVDPAATCAPIDQTSKEYKDS